MREFLVAILFWSASASAWALDSDIALAQLSHRAWGRSDDGPPAPAQINAIAQTPDGLLWLATSAGLYVFDGLKFDEGVGSQDLQSLDHTALLAMPDGTLWVGTRSGVVWHYDSGVVKTFGRDEGLAAGPVHAIVRDLRGTVWVASGSGLFQRQGSRWQRVGTAAGVSDGAVLGAFVARDGALWFARGDGVFSLSPGASRAVRVFAEHFAGRETIHFAQAPDGALWVSDPARGVLRIVSTSGAQPQQWRSVGRSSGALLFDHHGSLWIGGDRLRRQTAAPAAAMEEMTHADGLSGDVVRSVFEGREGDIWVGTQGGLDRFRQTQVVWVVNPRMGSHKVVVAGAAGRVWVADGEGSLLAFDNATLAKRLPAPRFTAGLRDRDGGLWFGGTEGIARLVNEERLEVTPFPAALRGSEVQALARDNAGVLWVSVDGKGLFRLTGRQWTAETNPALPAEAPLTATLDDGGNVWFGYTGSRLARVSASSVRVFTARDGLDVGNVTALHARASRLWVGGELSTMLFDGRDFIRVFPGACQPFLAVTGIVETADDVLWLFRRGAVSRVRRLSEQLKTMAPENRLDCESVGSSDEPAPTPQQLRPTPTLVEAADGRLWLAANEGLAWIDPRRPNMALALPAQARITNVAVGDMHYAYFQKELRLPVNTRDLTIQFRAVNLSNPWAVRYFYRLEGVDEAWRGSIRNEVIYTNLAPGRYRFQVTTSNWSAGDVGIRPSSLVVVIPPAFYQATWFRALCVLVALLLLALLYRWQVRRAGARLRARLEERMSERERIARELHDTLLQGIQALVLRFQGVAARIPAKEPARDLMERALELADDVIAEGRDRVNDLRDAGSTPADLSQEIARAGNEMLHETGIRFVVAVHGDVRLLHPIVREEASLITREALANAHRHAGPRVIEVNLFYDRPRLRLSIRDDGRGIDPAVLRAGGRERHWGLRGMRERATRIRGRLEIWSRPGAGTEIELSVPAAVAYRDERMRFPWLPFRARHVADLVERRNNS